MELNLNRPTSLKSPGWFVLAISVLFFISGFSSLAYQVAWNKILNQTVGMDHISVALIVSIFMLGLGLGGRLGSAITRRSQNYFFFFPLAEAMISGFAFVSVPILRFIPEVTNALTDDYGFLGFTLDFSLNLLVLIVPVMLMGVSLPIVVHTLRSIYPAGTATGYLYSANILGAACGALGTGIFLIGEIGIYNTIGLVATFNTILAISAFTLGLKLKSQLKQAKFPDPLVNVNLSEGSVREQGITRYQSLYIYGVSFIVGFVALAYEILYFRIFTGYFSMVSYVFPIILTSYLVMMALGNFLSGWAIKQGMNPSVLIGVLILGTVLSTHIIFYNTEIAIAISDKTKFTEDDKYYLAKKIKNFEDLRFNPKYNFAPLILCFKLSLISMLPVAFISGLFPVFVQIITNDIRSLGKNVGKIYFVQTLGNFLGALLAGLILTQIFGSLRLLQILGLSLLGVFVSYLIVFSDRTVGKNRGNYQRFLLVCWLSVVVSGIVSYRTDLFRTFTFFSGIPPYKILETPYGIGLFYKESPNADRLNMGAESVASYSTAETSTRFLADTYRIAEARALQGKDSPENILIIGVGHSWQVMSAVNLFPNAKIEVVELLEILIDAIKKNGYEETKKALGKVRIHISDGRRFVSKRKDSGRKYDLIYLDIYYIYSSGAGNLFTREFLSDMRSMLSGEGVLVMSAYVPAVKAGLQVFQNVIVVSRGEYKRADVFMVNNNEYDVSSFPENLHLVLKAMEKDVEKRGLRERVYFPGDIKRFTESAFAILDRDVLEALTADVTMQTDDLVASEYYLNNKVVFDQYQYFNGLIRYWPSAETPLDPNKSGKFVKVVTVPLGDILSRF